MKDYLKLAAIVALFVLGSASDVYADPFYQHNQQHQQNVQQGQQFTRDHQLRYQQAYNRRQDDQQYRTLHQQAENFGAQHGRVIRRWIQGGH